MGELGFDEPLVAYEFARMARGARGAGLARAALAIWAAAMDALALELLAGE